MFEQFTFDGDITEGQRRKLLERHAVAASNIANGHSLDERQRQSLAATYQGPISHSVSTNPDAYAEAYVGRTQIWINFALLFPRGDTEITQTLIHEMMHCAGFGHAMRGSSDVPGDGGQYYRSPPLQAELCVAGVQSDTTCIEIDGRCAIVDKRK